MNVPPAIRDIKYQRTSPNVPQWNQNTCTASRQAAVLPSPELRNATRSGFSRRRTAHTLPETSRPQASASNRRDRASFRKAIARSLLSLLPGLRSEGLAASGKSKRSFIDCSTT